MLRRRLYTISSDWCDRGDLRPSNQDCVLARQGVLSGCTVGLYLVADGCGGLAYGGEVSNLVAESFRRIWESALRELLASRDEAGILPALRSWTEQIHVEAYRFGQAAGRQVGSTLTLLLTLERKYYILHTGDSRAYLLRRGRLDRLTEDQSLVADMVRNRELAPEEAERFAHQNVLTMCLGCFEELRTFSTQGDLRKNDIFILCSDGLYRGLGEKQMASLLPRRVAAESAREFRMQIPAGAAQDNVSVVLVQVLSKK